jgi:hypothetical protein
MASRAGVCSVRPTGRWPRWSAGRRCALRHWARAAGVISCARWVRYSRLQGCLASILAPPAAPPPRAGIAGDWQTSDALRRENVKSWLFEIRMGEPPKHSACAGRRGWLRGFCSTESPSSRPGFLLIEFAPRSGGGREQL